MTEAVLVDNILTVCDCVEDNMNIELVQHMYDTSTDKNIVLACDKMLQIKYMIRKIRWLVNGDNKR